MITNRPSEGAFVLANEVREQSHVARAFDRVGQFALVPGAHAGALARHDLSEGGEIALERVGVLVIDRVHVLLAEPALLIERRFLLMIGGHDWGSRVSESDRSIEMNLGERDW